MPDLTALAATLPPEHQGLDLGGILDKMAASTHAASQDIDHILKAVDAGELTLEAGFQRLVPLVKQVLPLIQMAAGFLGFGKK